MRQQTVLVEEVFCEPLVKLPSMHAGLTTRDVPLVISDPHPRLVISRHRFLNRPLASCGLVPLFSWNVCRMATVTWWALPLSTALGAKHRCAWLHPLAGLWDGIMGPSPCMTRPSCAHTTGRHRICKTPHKCLAASPSIAGSDPRRPLLLRPVGPLPRRWG